MSKTILILMVGLFFTCQARAVLLQVDTGLTNEIEIRAQYFQDSTTNTDENTAVIDNDSDPAVADLFYDLNSVTGTAGWSTNLGNGSSFDFSVDQYSNVPSLSDGTILLEMFTASLTINIVAEAGETNGTPVTIDWAAAISGITGVDSRSITSIEWDSNSIFDETFDGATSSGTSYSASDSGQFTTYSIGDSFTLDISLSVDSVEGDEAAYDAGNVFSVSATVVPEPTSLSLLGLGALALLCRKRHGDRA